MSAVWEAWLACWKATCENWRVGSGTLRQAPAPSHFPMHALHSHFGTPPPSHTRSGRSATVAAPSSAGRAKGVTLVEDVTQDGELALVSATTLCKAGAACDRVKNNGCKLTLHAVRSTGLGARRKLGLAARLARALLLHQWLRDSASTRRPKGRRLGRGDAELTWACPSTSISCVWAVGRLARANR